MSAPPPEPPTLGVEEEFLLVDPDSLVPVEGAGELLVAHRRLHPDAAATAPQRELLTSMIETTTPVCVDLPGLRAELVGARSRLVEAAQKAGARVLANGTSPRPAPPRPESEAAHYRNVADLYGLLARGVETCGCHVHVGVADRDTAVAALNHLRPWLPLLLALSANSPYEHGVDTGFASWRTMILSRWPTTQIPPYFESARHYDATHATLYGTGVLPVRAKNAYWLARPSSHVPTLEIRVADVMPTVEEVVLQAGLSRALVATSLARHAAGTPAPRVPDHELSAALWTAARYGLGGPLIHPLAGTPVPAAEAVRALLDHVGPALEAFGDREEVATTARWLMEQGSPAERQRAVTKEPGQIGELGLL